MKKYAPRWPSEPNETNHKALMKNQLSSGQEAGNTLAAAEGDAGRGW